MAVRNFYVVASADGRESRVGIGPAKKDGGMKIALTQRDHGAIIDVVQIYCRTVGDKLMTEIIDDEGNCIKDFITER